jgi:hypothetical protein
MAPSALVSEGSNQPYYMTGNEFEKLTYEKLIEGAREAAENDRGIFMLSVRINRRSATTMSTTWFGSN